MKQKCTCGNNEYCEKDNAFCHNLKQHHILDAIEFAEWLNQNRWFYFDGEKWHYTHESGVVMSKGTVEKHYIKTSLQLYEMYLKSKK